MNYSDLCYMVRRKLKISQREFAEMIGSNQTEVSFIERGFVPNDKRKIEIIEEYARKVGLITNC